MINSVTVNPLFPPFLLGSRLPDRFRCLISACIGNNHIVISLIIQVKSAPLLASGSSNFRDIPLSLKKFIEPMTSGRAGGLQNVNRSSRIQIEGRLKVAFDRVPGPGGKGVPRKNHEAPLISRTGRASHEFAPQACFPVVGTPGRAPGSPPLFAETVVSSLRQSSSRRCFLRGTPLPPGHEPSLLEMSNSVSPP
jgi:hypothetical protein